MHYPCRNTHIFFYLGKYPFNFFKNLHAWVIFHDKNEFDENRNCTPSKIAPEQTKSQKSQNWDKKSQKSQNWDSVKWPSWSSLKSLNSELFEVSKSWFWELFNMNCFILKYYKISASQMHQKKFPHDSWKKCMFNECKFRMTRIISFEWHCHSLPDVLCSIQKTFVCFNLLPETNRMTHNLLLKQHQIDELYPLDWSEIKDYILFLHPESFGVMGYRMDSEILLHSNMLRFWRGGLWCLPPSMLHDLWPVCVSDLLM